MSCKLAAVLATGVLVIVSVGCQKKETTNTLPPFPKIPKGLESKPGFGAMGDKKPAAEPGKVDAPTTEGAAPAGEINPATEPPKVDAPATEGAAPAGETTPATEPGKVDAPTTEGAAPADSGAAGGSGETQKTN